MRLTLLCKWRCYVLSWHSADCTPSALTDPLLAGIAKGSDAYRLVGTYVTTSLNWYGSSRIQVYEPLIMNRAVATGKDSKFNAIKDLENTVIGISRIGRYIRALVQEPGSSRYSGSQTMAYVMAL